MACGLPVVAVDAESPCILEGGESSGGLVPRDNGRRSRGARSSFDDEV
jgi:hypothetical protein